MFYHDAHERTPVCCMLCAFCSALALHQTNDLSPLGTATSIPARLMNHLSSALKKIQNACTITEAQDEGEPSKRGNRNPQPHFVRLGGDIKEDATPRMMERGSPQ